MTTPKPLEKIITLQVKFVLRWEDGRRTEALQQTKDAITKACGAHEIRMIGDVK